MSKGNISKKQEEILEYIKSQILQRGFPPAVREICDAVNLKSTSSVHSHLETLEKNGYIPGLFLTASSPSSIWIWSAPYSALILILLILF